MAQNLIVMTEKEASRYEVIKRLVDGKINGTDASIMVWKIWTGILDGISVVK